MKKTSLVTTLKQAIEKSGQTRYAVAKGAGVGYSVLKRFLDDDRDIRISTVAALAEYLGLELKPKKGAGGR